MDLPAAEEVELFASFDLTQKFVHSDDNIGIMADVTDDNLSDVTNLSVGYIRYEIPPPGTTTQLSPQIGRCTSLKELATKGCSHIPLEISKCQSLFRLILANCTAQIDLPKDIVLNGLGVVIIYGGNWNEETITGLLTWLAECAPNLRSFYVRRQAREMANLFMDGLSQNDLFINQFEFSHCNLTEEDTRRLIVDIIQPFFPQTILIHLKDNNIQGLETLGPAVETLLATANGDPILSNLRLINLFNNPVLTKLKSSENPDEAAAVSLLRTCPKLCLFYRCNTSLPLQQSVMKMSTLSLSIIYQCMINKSELRYLIEDDHGGSTRLGFWPALMKSFRDIPNDDPNPIFVLLREGPLLNYIRNENTIIDGGGNNIDSIRVDSNDNVFDGLNDPLLDY